MASLAKSPTGSPPSRGQILSKRSLTGGQQQGAYPPTKLPGSPGLNPPPRNGGIPGYQPGMIRPTKPGGPGNLLPSRPGMNRPPTGPLLPGRPGGPNMGIPGGIGGLRPGPDLTYPNKPLPNFPGKFPGRRPGNFPGKYPSGRPGVPVTNPLVPGRLNPDLLRQMAARRLGG